MIIVAPGYSKKTGYYLRTIRDKELIEEIGHTVITWHFTRHIRKYGFFHAFSYFWKRSFSLSHIFCENISTILPVYILSKIKRIKPKKVFISHGSLEDLKPYRFYYIKYPFYYTLEKYALKNFENVVCVSEVMRKDFSTRKSTKTSIATIPNVPSIEFIESISKLKKLGKESLRTTLTLPSDRKIICYCGNIQAWQKVDLLIETCSFISKLSQEFFFVFLTKEEAAFREMLSSTELKEDSFIVKSVQNLEVPKYLVASDYLYSVREINEINRVSCPTKLVEYLYSGSNIISSEHIGDISNLINKYNLGLVVSEELIFSAQNLANHIVNCIENNRAVEESRSFNIEESIFSPQDSREKMRVIFNG